MGLKSLVNKFVYNPHISKSETYLVGLTDGMVLRILLDGRVDEKVFGIGASILAHYAACYSGRRRQARLKLDYMQGE